jgi:Asp-tRNA(Asn)/Glu-tRNA(Gln) amidotransferase A subunit family amidase
MSKAPLCKWSATQIATATQEGSLTAIEATEAAIARMEEVNPDLIGSTSYASMVVYKFDSFESALEFFTHQKWLN